MSDLRLSTLSRVNLSRCNEWHAPNGINDWSISDWAVAMAGEAGEVCNAVKKLRRIESRLKSKNAKGRQIDTREQALAKIGSELADTLLYLDLIASRIGINLADEVIKKFNATSVEYGFDQRLQSDPNINIEQPWDGSP